MEVIRQCRLGLIYGSSPNLCSSYLRRACGTPNTSFTKTHRRIPSFTIPNLAGSAYPVNHSHRIGGVFALACPAVSRRWHVVTAKPAVNDKLGAILGTAYEACFSRITYSSLNTISLALVSFCSSIATVSKLTLTLTSLGACNSRSATLASSINFTPRHSSTSRPCSFPQALPDLRSHGLRPELCMVCVADSVTRISYLFLAKFGRGGDNVFHFAWTLWPSTPRLCYTNADRRVLIFIFYLYFYFTRILPSLAAELMAIKCAFDPRECWGVLLVL